MRTALPTPEQLFELRHIGVAGATAQNNYKDNLYAGLFVMREIDGYEISGQTPDDYHWSKRILGRVAVNGGEWDMQIQISEKRCGENNNFYENEKSHYMFAWNMEGVTRAVRLDRYVFGVQKPSLSSWEDRQIYDSDDMDHEVVLESDPQYITGNECEALAIEMQAFARSSSFIHFRSLAVTGDSRRPGRILESSVRMVR